MLKHRYLMITLTVMFLSGALYAQTALIKGLMWQDEVYTKDEKLAYAKGQIFGKSQDWSGANAYCQNLQYGGFHDWYLPSKEELQLLYKNNSTLKNKLPHYFWSSSQKSSAEAWMVYFEKDFTNHANKSQVAYVRCMRQ